MTEREKLERAIAAMEAQRHLIGDGVADAAIASYQQKLTALEPAGGRRRPVTVLVARLRESAAPDWKRLEIILARFGALVESPDEDTRAAIFGADSPREDEASTALRAALDMQEEARRMAVEQGQENSQLRIGIHTGPALFTLVGGAPAFTPLGDTLTLAGAVQDAAQPGEIYITQPTLRAARGLFDIQSLDPLPISGRGEDLPVYRVRGLRPNALRVGPQGVSLPVMIGRDAELDALEAAFEDSVRAGALRMVTITGAAGVGKTRLLHELLRRFDEQGRSYLLFRGRADPVMNYLPHALLRELLSFRFKILDSDPQPVAQARLIQGIEEWLGAEGEESAHWIGQWAGFDFTSSPYLAGRLDDTLRSRSSALAHMRRLLSAVAVQTPLLVLADDLQWADDGSLDAIEALTRSGINGPGLVVVMARPGLWERRPNWGRHAPAHQRLTLDPLSANDSAALASLTLRSALVGAQRTITELITLPARLIDRIVENSAGNPLFIEELVQSYLEYGVLVSSSAGDAPSGQPGDLAWRVDMTRLAALRPPASLEEAVQAHLEGLPPAERAVIQHAALIGQVFWDTAACALLEADRESSPVPLDIDLPRVLQVLQARGLIQRRESPAFEGCEEYQFHSASLHEVAARSVPAEQARAGHRRAAAWLSQQSGERRELYASAIAGQYDLAGEPELAADWYGRAAQQARLISAPEASVRFFHRALEILPADPSAFTQRAALFAGLWDVQWWQGQYEEALETARQMRSAAVDAGDEPFQAAAWNRIAAVFNRLGDPTPALRANQNAERIARRAGATGEVVKALFNRGMTLFKIGNAAGALEAGEQALAFNQSMLSGASEREAARESARILTLLGMIHQRAGRYAQAEQGFRQALDFYNAQTEPASIISTLNNLGENASLQGDYQQAAGCYQEAIQLARQHAYPDLELISLNGLAGAQVELGAYTAAEEAAREVLRRSQGQDWLSLSDVYRSLAGACLGRDQLQSAFEAGQRALELAFSEKSPAQVGRAWRMLGRIAACPLTGRPLELQGKPFDAHTCYAASLQVFVEQGLAAEQARTIREWALSELETGDRAEGVRLWKEAREFFARLGLTVEVERMDRRPVSRTGALTPR